MRWASLFDHFPPVPAHPPCPATTKLSVPKNIGVMKPLLILSPTIGDPREGRGFVANLPILGPLRRHG